MNSINFSSDIGKPEMITGLEGVQIPVNIYGEDQPFTPVLMMHGLESHAGWFWQSGEFLASTGHPTYIVDRRGSGRSAELRGDCKDYHDILDDIKSVTDFVGQKHHCNKVILFGHCFGAIPSVIFSMQNPAQIEALILSTPAIFTHADLKIEEKIKVISSKLTGKVTMIPTPVGDPMLFTRDEQCLDFILKDKLKLKTASTRLFWQVLNARIYIQAHVKKVTVPVLMTTAGKDEICDNKKNINFFNHIGSLNKTHINYPNAIHILEYSPDRQRFFVDLKNWLDTIN